MPTGLAMAQSPPPTSFKESTVDQIINALKQEGYDFGIAIATQAEINAGAACGQLSIVTE